MRHTLSIRGLFIRALSLVLTTGTVAADGPADSATRTGLLLPWKQAGLTERQAAAHLLDRFAFGARPGEVDDVVALGLENWLALQLLAEADDPPQLDPVLQRVPALDWPTRRIAEVYPSPGVIRREAEEAGVATSEKPTSRDSDEPSGEMRRFAEKEGYRPQRELVGGLLAQKLIRAVYSENQLQEVLADFWFNHFNVSLTDPECRAYVATYERDAIRPHVLGKLRSMIEATARHPAMLLYLDNARSVAEDGAPTTFSAERYFDERAQRFGRFGLGRDRMRPDRDERRAHGLNENYARELLELHTLGVDGGYTQDDVVAVARAFSGWTTYPPGARRDEIEDRIARVHRFPDTGFVFDDELIFRANAHDAGEKRILGHVLPAGRGIEDGLDVLDLLAAHPSTARHLARKLAVRFVSDEPTDGLVDRLAATYRASGGDLREMMIAIAESPEFWSTAARQSKIKSPFELAVSALRALDAEVGHPRELVEWIARMGQPLYAYQAPTGYPDRAEAWVNTGSLLNRMNFGLELATGRIAGVRVDLLALNGGREPDSLDAALRAYVPLLLPERDAEAAVERLGPVVADPDIADKVARAAPERPRSSSDESLFWDDSPKASEPERTSRRYGARRSLAYVVGVILGSPEFQRR